ncbi:hypothetical protein NPIL_550001 [Nephila pilipes]|uniref:Uncharacterized protein n=1 Tax=Nephila pilipes TaxID=299642 RepID=A0A8X6Q644_NEPPI|nr:hypothetical protein NPIL_550001 [Nephila pilipes]
MRTHRPCTGSFHGNADPWDRKEPPRTGLRCGRVRTLDNRVPSRRVHADPMQGEKRAPARGLDAERATSAWEGSFTFLGEGRPTFFGPRE